LAVVTALVLITLLRDFFRPLGFVMETLLILLVVISALYLLILWKRPGTGPASENADDLLAVARVRLEQGEISREDYARLKKNLRDNKD
jgi:uncharacterized membrane protein